MGALRAAPSLREDRATAYLRCQRSVGSVESGHPRPRATAASGRGGVQLPGHGGRIRHRRPACVSAAHIRGRAPRPPDPRPSARATPPSGAPGCPSRHGTVRWGRYARRRRQQRPGGRVLRTPDHRHLDRFGQRGLDQAEQLPEAAGQRAMPSASRSPPGRARSTPGSSKRCPVARSSSTAREVPEGTALSMGSRGRTKSSLALGGVVEDARAGVAEAPQHLLGAWPGPPPASAAPGWPHRGTAGRCPGPPSPRGRRGSQPLPPFQTWNSSPPGRSQSRRKPAQARAASR